MASLADPRSRRGRLWSSNVRWNEVLGGRHYLSTSSAQRRDLAWHLADVPGFRTSATGCHDIGDRLTILWRMSRARLVITAVVAEGRPVAEVAAAYGVHRSWIYKLLARYRAEGEAAFQPRSRHPKTSPAATSSDVAELVLELRKDLSGQGLDAGPDTICWHLQQHHQITLPPVTIWRILKRAGQITPEPHKRPRSSYIRFEASLPNEMWQTDFTQYRLATGRDVEGLNFIDDHSRYLLACTAFTRVTGQAVVTTFVKAITQYDVPASVLSDNGMVYTTRFSGGKGGRNGFENQLHQPGVVK